MKGPAAVLAIGALRLPPLPAAALAIPWEAWPAAALVGLSLGLLGSGGSILTVPLLQSVVGLPFLEAKATSFPIVGLVAAFGLAPHLRRRAVRWRAVLPFVAASLPCAFLANRWLAPLLAERAQVLLFAALMLVAAWRMAFARVQTDAQSAASPLPVVLALAALAGTLTGLLGVGGGFVIVPSLVLTLGFPVREAVATSLLVIALNCAASLLATAAQGSIGLVHLDLAALFSAVGVLGALLGGGIGARLSPRLLRRVFASVIVAMAVWTLVSIR